MKILINKKEVNIFAGATWADCVLSYSKRSYQQLLDGKLCLYDKWGNLTEPDGPASEGQMMSLKKQKK